MSQHHDDLSVAAWSSGMILASGARGPGLNSRSSPFRLYLSRSMAILEVDLTVSKQTTTVPTIVCELTIMCRHGLPLHGQVSRNWTFLMAFRCPPPREQAIHMYLPGKSAHKMLCAGGGAQKHRGPLPCHPNFRKPLGSEHWAQPVWCGTRAPSRINTPLIHHLRSAPRSSRDTAEHREKKKESLKIRGYHNTPLISQQQLCVQVCVVVVPCRSFLGAPVAL